MRRTFLVLTLVVLTGVLLVSTTACCPFFNAGEEAAEEAIGQATGTDVEIDEDGDSVTITGEGEEGDVTIQSGEGSDLPDTYPDDFPLYPGEVTASSSMSSSEGMMVSVSVTTKDGQDEVEAWFDDELAAEGWTVAFKNETSGEGMTTVSYVVSKGEARNGSIAITVEDGETIVSHTVVAE